MVLLHEIAADVVSAATIKRLFPNRSIPATRKRLSGVRRELGIETKASGVTHHLPMLRPDDPGCDDSWQRDFAARAAQANMAYLAAFQQAA